MCIRDRNQGDIRPLPLDDLWRHLEDALDFSLLARRLNLPDPHFRAGSGFLQLLQWLESLAGARGSGFDSACDLSTPINERRLHRLVEDHRGESDVMVAGMLIMLALVYLRFGSPEFHRQPEWELARMGQNGRLPLDGFVHQLGRRLESPATIFEVARWLYSCLLYTSRCV